MAAEEVRLLQPSDCVLQLEQMRRDIQRIRCYTELRHESKPLCKEYNYLVHETNQNPKVPRQEQIKTLQKKINSMLEKWLQITIERFSTSVQKHCL